MTRLRPRKLRFLPTVVIDSWRSAGQIRDTFGFIGGYLASGPRFALWTVTVWDDEHAMRVFRNASSHLKAMPRLIGSCDEASVAHWRSPDLHIPEPEEAAARMKAIGRTSKLHHSSQAHAAGDSWPDGVVPRVGPRLAPRR